MTKRSVTHATFRIEKNYAATPERVFAAWSSAEAKTKWFAGPPEWTSREYSLDFRVGGSENSKVGPKDGPLHCYHARYHDIVQNERIVLTYDMYMDDLQISVSLMTVELFPDGKGTKLVFTEQGAFLDGHDTSTQREQGTHGLLVSLERALQNELVAERK